MVDAVIPKPGYGRQFYVFSGINYTTIEIDSDFHDTLVGNQSYDVRSGWAATLGKGGWGAVDAIVTVSGGTSPFYAFVGGNYVGFSVDPDTQKDDSYYGKLSTGATWKGLVNAGFDSVDAAIQDPSDSDILFFFRGTKSLKYSFSGDKVISGPEPITSYWPGIGKAGFDSIDSIFKTPNGDSYYVFKGDQYARITWTGGWDTLELGPKAIRGNWSTLENWI